MSAGEVRALKAREGRRLVRVEGFEPALFVAGADKDAYERRFSMLLVDEGEARSGGICRVFQAAGPTGERFALKMLQTGADGVDPEREAVLRAAFDEEYRVHSRLGGLRGFPRLFGRGIVDGAPAIVMEWVDGVTLEQASRCLSADDVGRMSPLWAARLGRDLFDVLDRMAYVDGIVVHRDISPRNIMVDTSQMSLQEQADEGVFELRVIDFGSAALVRDDRGVRGGPVLRSGATPAYAAPELLARPGSHGCAPAPSMDVYAVASVLYALVEGRPPYDIDPLADERASLEAIRRRKEAGRPRAMVGAHGGASEVAQILAREPEVAVSVGRAAGQLEAPPSANQVRAALMAVDARLDEVVLACLQPDSAKRLSATEAKGALAAFAQNYAANIGHALEGEPLEPCMGDRRSRRASRSLRTMAVNGLRALAAAVCVVAAVVAGVLSNGMTVSLSLAGAQWEGAVPGAAVSLAVALPLIAGLVGRRGDIESYCGFAGGLIGCFAGTAVSGAAVALTAWPSPAVACALGAAIASCAAAATAWLTGDRLLARKPAATPSGVGGYCTLPEGERDAETADREPMPGGGAEIVIVHDAPVDADGGQKAEELA